MSEKPDHCRNCGTPIRGEYCANCGQREGRPDMHLREVAGEWLEDLDSLDSRLWRTLWALLFKPGFLSAEFNAGSKAPCLPPFRLYLIISFIMFLLLSVTSGLDVYAEIDPGSLLPPTRTRTTVTTISISPAKTAPNG